MSGPLAYLNGQLIPRDDAALSIHDAGLVFGATVTDYCRTFRHRLFRWPDHLARFRHGCAACFIPLQLDDAELTAVAHDLVAHNAQMIESYQELALITFATPGAFGAYAGSPAQNGPPTLCLHTVVISFAGYRPFFATGLALAVPGSRAAASEDLTPPRVKHRNRLHWWRADHLLRQRSPRPGVPDNLVALLTDGNGCLTETAFGNLLIVRDGTILTPPPDQVLDGISLRIIEEICDQIGIPFARQPLTLDDCAAASEAMLCGSAFCVVGVRWIEGRDIPWPGPITQRLLAAWSDCVGVDIAGQILSNR